MLDKRALFLVIALVATVTGAAAAAPVRVAVFDFELIDTSLDGSVGGPKAAETARLDRLGVQLRAAVAAAPGFALADIAAVQAAAHAQNLQACGGCDRKFAQTVDAQWAITGTVQKVSNLILNINIYVKDVGTGELRQVMSADIRGNTDESWQRGLGWLIRNRLKLAP